MILQSTASKMRYRAVLKYGVIIGALSGAVASLRFNDWDLATHGAVRFGRAALTSGRIMVDYKLSLWGVDKKNEEYGDIISQVHKRTALRLLELCCANKGAFIKVGQHLGALDYLLPEEIVSTLSVLHSRAPKSSLEDVLLVIKEDLKKDPSEIFTSFDPEPVGAASLAQVHKAVTKDGTVVAVKVQHRFVKARARVDMKTMEVLTNIAARIFPDFNLLWLAEQAKKNLPVELNFIHEGQNADRVRRMFRHYKWFKVPEIFWDLSSDRVLTMEYCEGGEVNDRQYAEKHGISPSEITQNLGELFSEMIFVHGYVHCDPHPGNILIHNDDRKLRIILLDHGLYATLPDSFRLHYANMWMSILNADEEGIERNANNLGVKGHLFVVLASMLTARAWKSIKAGIDNHSFSETENNEIKAYVGKYLNLISEVLNVVPREMILLFKTNDLLRSIEYALKSPANASSFINMSRCCIRAVTQDRIQKCNSIYCTMSSLLKERWILLKITIYQIYVWFQVFCNRQITMPLNNFTR